MKNRIVLILFLLSLVYSCEELNLQEADDNVSVVECYLIPGDTINVKIVKQLIFNSSDTVCEYLDSLEVYLSDGEEDYLLSYLDSGVYQTTALMIEASKTYTLQFEYNAKIINAVTEIPSKPENFSISDTVVEPFTMGRFPPGGEPEMPDSIGISWSNETGDYYMIVVENIESDPDLINDYEDDDRPPRIFRNTPTQSASQELNPQTFIYYGTHRIILFHLNAEYAALYEQLGRSSLDITAPPTNVENGLGIFTGINSDTLLIEVE